MRHWIGTGILFITVFMGCGRSDNIEKKQETIEKTKKSSETQTSEEDLPAKSLATTQANENENMVFFDGGTIMMGSNEGMPNAAPAFEANVEPFYIAKHPVTVAQFREFTEATGFVTEAEKFGDAGVYDLENNNWELVQGTTWQYPLGPSKPAAKPDHPVTQVSWNDAVAYCEWAGYRLPTEMEWEYAARGGKNDGDKFSWGNEVVKDDKFLANVWQGDLSTQQGADGYIFTSPVGQFGETPSGLTDMGGNVWEWCQSTFRPYPGGQPFRVNPNVKVIRGGSFFFDQAGEESYTVYFRGNNSVETSLFNLGFRCAKSAE